MSNLTEKRNRWANIFILENSTDSVLRMMFKDKWTNDEKQEILNAMNRLCHIIYENGLICPERINIYETSSRPLSLAVVTENFDESLPPVWVSIETFSPVSYVPPEHQEGIKRACERMRVFAEGVRQ